MSEQVVELINKLGLTAGLIVFAVVFIALNWQKIAEKVAPVWEQRYRERQAAKAADKEENKETLDKLLDKHERSEERWHQLFREAQSAKDLAIEQRIDGAKVAEKSALQAIDVMQQMADISRMMVDRQDKRDVHYLEMNAQMLQTIKETTQINGAIGFVLSQLYFQGQQGKTFSDLIDAMDSEKHV